MGIITMSSEPNSFQVGTRSPDEFRMLLRRHLVLVSQLSLASKDFGDLSGLPKEHVAAALVVQEASAELQVLHDKLQEWCTRQSHAPNAPAASVTEAAAARSPAVSLVLKEYALDRKVNVIRVVREIVPGYSLTTAKALVERELPVHIADGLAPEKALAMRQKFEAAGAVCIIAAC
jgi:large subunit ribosomal protein L7/L12